ncbi:MAG: hypothetical protein EA393_03315 [Bacteroidetes bacterium]|nr:MAG: hypothetical protein EA393_03315 [Bacteroidota bacterium]
MIHRFSQILNTCSLHYKILYTGMLLSFLLLCNFVYSARDYHKRSHDSVIVHTDRDAYVSGEELFYRVTLISQYDQHSNFVYMALRNSHQEIIKGSIVPLNHKSSYGSIYLFDTLSTGFYQLIVYTGDMRNYPEEKYFTKLLFVANRFDVALENLMELEEEVDKESEKNVQNLKDAALPTILPDQLSINIYTDKEFYSRREPVKLSVSADMLPGVVAEMSVSVTAKQSIWPFLHDHLAHNFSEKALGGTEPENHCGLVFPREIDGPVIAGKLIHESGENYVYPGVRVILSTPDTLTTISYTHTNDQGHFFFTLNPYYYERPLYLTLDTATYKGKAPEIFVEDPFNIHSPFKSYSGNIDRKIPPQVRESQDIVKVQKAFEKLYGSVIKENEKEELFPPRLYSAPENIINPANYLPLDNFPEIAREIIPSVRIRGQKNNWQIRMLNGQTAYTFFDHPPTVFLNNLPVSNLDMMMNLTSEQIKAIEVHNLPWRYGAIRFNGILSVFTHKPFVPSTFLPEPFYELDPIVVKQNSEYALPDYQSLDKDAQRIPDFRQLLYWNPKQTIDDEKKFTTTFHTGDLEGTYIILIRGVLNTGQTFQTYHSFDVKL